MPEKEVMPMPRKPKKPCAFPGCPKLTDGLYCEEHKKIVNQQYEKYGRKYKRSERYGSAWQKVRTRYVKLHPFCELCFEEGYIGHADIGFRPRTPQPKLILSCHFDDMESVRQRFRHRLPRRFRHWFRPGRTVPQKWFPWQKRQRPRGGSSPPRGLLFHSVSKSNPSRFSGVRHGSVSSNARTFFSSIS